MATPRSGTTPTQYVLPGSVRVPPSPRGSVSSSAAGGLMGGGSIPQPSMLLRPGTYGQMPSSFLPRSVSFQSQEGAAVQMTRQQSLPQQQRAQPQQKYYVQVPGRQQPMMMMMPAAQMAPSGQMQVTMQTPMQMPGGMVMMAQQPAGGTTVTQQLPQQA
eukprot:CAMPEP_0195138056 /NCGR_PEP_ID=MMETSP0448-20130528/157069_1 /TAXON_ID=66468 /ORGANISM="Heterocapsa triquestra, Strain CCMP 448" /LENGTH=158 /DNA_ID=CAMNT_0040176311 /DNA_START=8 /DNA_END=481 /DNA_ORIENTATION=-